MNIVKRILWNHVYTNPDYRLKYDYDNWTNIYSCAFSIYGFDAVEFINGSIKTFNK